MHTQTLQTNTMGSGTSGGDVLITVFTFNEWIDKTLLDKNNLLIRSGHGILFWKNSISESVDFYNTR